MPFIGNQPTQGRFIELDSLTASATANYTLQLNSANFSPESVNNLLVSINGVIQGSSTMSLNGAVLTVGATLSSSDTIDFVRVFGNVGTVSTPTDGSVTANKIGTGAVNLTSKVSGVLPVANGGTGATSFAEANSVIETFYYHSGDVVEGNNDNLDQSWNRLTTNSTANKNGGMSASSGLWTFPSTGIWNVTLSFVFYDTQASNSSGVLLMHSSDGGSNFNAVHGGYQAPKANNAHAFITLPYTFNITNTSNERILYRISSGGNLNVRGGSSWNTTKVTFIKLCPSV